MNDPSFEIDRFLIAQTDCYEFVVAELANGKKVSHWMWYIFPQIFGLGKSSESIYYSIKSKSECDAYVADATLRKRLIECIELIMNHKHLGAEKILGKVDAVKFKSSLTLFHLMHPEIGIFKSALDAFFNGQLDPLTINLAKGLKWIS